MFSILETIIYLVNIINSFLLTRQFSVKINDSTSDPKHISTGVSLGSKHGQILFNIYVSDISQ